jgi:hypothetical protein
MKVRTADLLTCQLSIQLRGRRPWGESICGNCRGESEVHRGVPRCGIYPKFHEFWFLSLWCVSACYGTDFENDDARNDGIGNGLARWYDNEQLCTRVRQEVNYELVPEAAQRQHLATGRRKKLSDCVVALPSDAY